MTPKATSLESGEDPFAQSMTDVLLDLGEKVSVDKLVLTPAAETVLVEADYELLVWNGGSWVETEWTARGGKNHVFTLNEDAETRYVLLRYKGDYDGAAYFSEVYSNISVILTATGEETVMTEGMTARTFAPNAGYLPGGID